MLKISVRPLAIRNSSMPNSTPFKVEMITSSNTGHPLIGPSAMALSLIPVGVIPGRRSRRGIHTPGNGHESLAGWGPGMTETNVTPEILRVRPPHLANGRQDGVWGIDFGDDVPAPSGLFLIERLVCSEITEGLDVHWLEELVIVGSHESVAADEHVCFHVFELRSDLAGLSRFRVRDGGGEHPHFVDGARIQHCDIIFRAQRLFELL